MSGVLLTLFKTPAAGTLSSASARYGRVTGRSDALARNGVRRQGKLFKRPSLFLVRDHITLERHRRSKRCLSPGGAYDWVINVPVPVSR
ncbi:hypothetical protein KCP73_13285 [Salmonella enterica subsp. enterica]|nr:hypothetical protein KCP73_13285 [Salmonella enterica subsp. enterica]